MCEPRDLACVNCRLDIYLFLWTGEGPSHQWDGWDYMNSFWISHSREGRMLDSLLQRPCSDPPMGNHPTLPHWARKESEYPMGQGTMCIISLCWLLHSTPGFPAQSLDLIAGNKLVSCMDFCFWGQTTVTSMCREVKDIAWSCFWVAYTWSQGHTTCGWGHGKKSRKLLIVGLCTRVCVCVFWGR